MTSHAFGRRLGLVETEHTECTRRTLREYAAGEYAATHHFNEVAPETIGFYAVLSNIYAAAGQWDKVSKVREMMEKGGDSERAQDAVNRR